MKKVPVPQIAAKKCRARATLRPAKIKWRKGLKKVPFWDLYLRNTKKKSANLHRSPCPRKKPRKIIIIFSCMRVNRGPPGYKIVRAPFRTCETVVSINTAGYFTYTNYLAIDGENVEFQVRN